MKNCIHTLLIAVLAVTLLLAGCATKSQSGALIGAGAGAGLGQVIGGDTKSTVIGGAVGAGAGYLIGRHQDKKADSDSPQPLNQTTVTVTNSNGSTTPVTLTKEGKGWLGPKGEYYPTLPTPEELKPAYGF